MSDANWIFFHFSQEPNLPNAGPNENCGPQPQTLDPTQIKGKLQPQALDPTQIKGKLQPQTLDPTQIKATTANVRSDTN